jgi:hypothetical protein
VRLDEAAFEAFIANWLVTRGGYQAVKNDKEQSESRDFDPVFGLVLQPDFVILVRRCQMSWSLLVGSSAALRVSASQRS